MECVCKNFSPCKLSLRMSVHRCSGRNSSVSKTVCKSPPSALKEILDVYTNVSSFIKAISHFILHLQQQVRNEQMLTFLEGVSYLMEFQKPCTNIRYRDNLGICVEQKLHATPVQKSLTNA